MKTRRPPAQARGCWGWGWGGNNRGNAGNQHFITGMERKKRRKGAPSGAWKTHFNERRQRPSRCLWTIWTRKSPHKSRLSSNYTCNFALFITLAPLLCEYRISSLVFLSIAEQTGQRDVGQLDTLALAWRPSDKCSYFVSISSSLQITGTICMDVVRTAFCVLFTMNILNMLLSSYLYKGHY